MSERGHVAVAVLAAGRGARGGFDAQRPKPLVELRGRPLVDWALTAASESGLRPVVLVVGYAARRVTAAATPGVNVVRARRWRGGISRSLRAALGALDGRAQVGAVCIGLADQPLVGPESYRRLAAAYHDGATLAVATYGGARRNPVLVARELWGETAGLRGDEGARALMRTHPVTEVPCDGTGSAEDVDTLEALAALERQMEA